MKKFILLFLFLGICQWSIAQNSCTNYRYIHENFTTHYISDVTYCPNVPELIPPYTFEGLTTDVDLHMDMRIPNIDISTTQADTATKRPAIIWAHSGGFIIGDKDADDMQALIDTFARKGFVAVSMQYRLGLDPVFDSESPERAVWRAVQDGSAAVRFLRENATVLGIDPNLIFIAGSSAGGFIAVHVAYAEDSERPSTTYSSFLTPDLGNKNAHNVLKYNSFLPNLNVNGNVAGNYNSYPKGTINCWGAIGDPNWINSPTNTVPNILFHGDQDDIVPIGQGEPFGVPWFPTTYGSLPIHNRSLSEGIYSDLNVYVGYGHLTWGADNGYWNPPGGGPQDMANWLEIINKTTNFMYLHMKPTAPIITGPVSVLTASTQTYTIAAPVSGSTYCWEISGGEIVEYGPDNAWIEVAWGAEGSAYVKTREVNCNVLESDWTTLNVSIVCSPDNDLDAYAAYPCGTDCDDTDVNNWQSCLTCVDADGDGWYVGCDAYITINGPDCDDSNPAKYPGSSAYPEIPNNGMDDDCDGEIDEAEITVCLDPSSPISIPSDDATGITVNLPVNIPNLTPCHQIADVNFWVYATHDEVGDLLGYLKHPDNTNRLLFQHPGPNDTSCGEADLYAIFNDEATLTYADFDNMCNSTPPAINGTFQPLNSLSIFDGKAPNGTWKFNIIDDVWWDWGELQNTCIYVRVESTCSIYYADADNDGYGTAQSLCLCAPSGIYTATQTGDCDDNNANIHPYAPELCDGLDNNCNGLIDDGIEQLYYLDADGDGFGNPKFVISTCNPPANFVLVAGDCDDTNANVNPNMPEVCNGIDDNCNLTTDEGLTTVYYKDKDGDGYGDPNNAIVGCTAPPQYVANGNDCDDENPNINPAASEICNGKDDNCNLSIDEGMTDTDNDGICDSLDNCPATANGTQEDIDSDGIGDMCDTENLISCEDVYIVTLTYANGDVLTYRAADHIVAYNQIQSGAQIVYDAGEYIDLMNGFTANEGADFTALISGCVGVAKNEDNTDNTENIVEINKLEEDNNINFVAYPNPAADKLNIAFKVDTDVRTNISLYNMQGQQLQQIFNQKVPANSPQNISLELGEIPSGVYILQLSTTDGESKYIKVAVQR